MNNYDREYLVTFDQRTKYRDIPYFAIVYAKDKKTAERLVDLACYNKSCNRHPFYPFHKHTVLYKPSTDTQGREKYKIYEYDYVYAREIGLID